MIDTRNIEFLGSDYDRYTDCFLDKSSGKVYKRSYEVMGGYKKGDIFINNAKTVELVDGDLVTNKADLDSSLNIRN